MPTSAGLRARRGVSAVTAWALVLGLLVAVGSPAASAATPRRTPASTAAPTPQTQASNAAPAPHLRAEPQVVVRLATTTQARARLQRLLAAYEAQRRQALAQVRQVQAAQQQARQVRAAQQSRLAQRAGQLSPQQLAAAQRTGGLTAAQVRKIQQAKAKLAAQQAKAAALKAQQEKAAAAQAEANARIKEALAALAKALSTSACTTVGGNDGSQASISCPLENGTGTVTGGSGTSVSVVPGTGTASDSTPALLTASSAPETPATDGDVTEGQVDAALAQAKGEWQAAGADTSGITAGVDDLGGLALGATSGTSISIDRDAAGWGWDVAGGSGPRMDLLTVVRHEMGHALGLDHTASGLMAEDLAPGETRSVASAPELPASSQADSGDAAPADQTSDQSAPSSDQSASDAPSGSGDQAAPAGDPAAPAAGASEQGDGSQPQGSADAGDKNAAQGAGSTDGGSAAGDDASKAEGSDGGEGGNGTAGDAQQPSANGGTTGSTGPTWTVQGTRAVLTADTGTLSGTLSYDAATHRLVFTGSRAVTVDASVLTTVVVQGTQGDDRLTVDLSGAPAGLAVSVVGGSGDDGVVLAAAGDADWAADGDDLTATGPAASFSARGVELVVNLAPRTIRVDSAGRRLDVTGTAGSVRVSGLVAGALLAFGAPLVAALLDAGAGSVTLGGGIDWSATGADLRVHGRSITVTSGASIDTGTGLLELAAHDGGAGSQNAAASVDVRGASLTGGAIVLSADALVDLVAGATAGSASADVTVLDSTLTALRDVSLLASSTATGTTNGDGSASLSLSSSASSHLGGTSTVSAGGDLVVRATNRADGSATRGGAAGVTVDRVTRAYVDGSGRIDVDDLVVDADGDSTVRANASDAVDGAAATLLVPGAVALPVAAALGYARLRALTEAFLSAVLGQALTIRAFGGQSVTATGRSDLGALAGSAAPPAPVSPPRSCWPTWPPAPTSPAPSTSSPRRSASSPPPPAAPTRPPEERPRPWRCWSSTTPPTRRSTTAPRSTASVPSPFSPRPTTPAPPRRARQRPTARATRSSCPPSSPPPASAPARSSCSPATCPCSPPSGPPRPAAPPVPR